MKRGLRWLILIGATLLLGVAGGELIFRWPTFRDLAGRVAGRGPLVAITNGKGIYEADLGGDEEASAADKIAVENLRQVSAALSVDQARVDRELSLLKAQFGDEKKFAAALRSAGFSNESLREQVESQLRGVAWLEKQIAAGIAVTEQEARASCGAHPDLFAQPQRYRASHLFLAAHEETPSEVAEEKEKAIMVLATRLSQRETLSQLAVEVSEDEASKPRGGDLNYLAETRMPTEFIAEVQKLRVGETSKPFRSHLGFHIVQLTDIKPPRQLTFDEVRPEIFLTIANERRAREINRLASNLSQAAR